MQIPSRHIGTHFATPRVAQLQHNHHLYQPSLTYSTTAPYHISQSPNDQYTTTQSPNTIYDRKKNVVVSIHETDTTKHTVSACDSDDEIQQPPPKQFKTKYEGLKVVELKKLCKERDLRRSGVKKLLVIGG